jgi:hypothetical protein
MGYCSSVVMAIIPPCVQSMQLIQTRALERLEGSLWAIVNGEHYLREDILEAAAEGLREPAGDARRVVTKERRSPRRRAPSESSRGKPLR